MPSKEGKKESFLYQAQLTSCLLKDKGLYQLEVKSLNDGLLIYFPSSYQVAFFHSQKEGVYRLYIWNKKLGWVKTSSYGHLNELVAILARDYMEICRGW